MVGAISFCAGSCAALVLNHREESGAAARMNFAKAPGRPGLARTRVKANDADDQPTDRESTRSAKGAQEGASSAAVAAEARRLHARLHDHAEEAELGAS